MVDGIADFDDLIGTLREKRELAQTFESEKNEKESAIMEKGPSTGLKFPILLKNDDDFQNGVMPIYKSIKHNCRSAGSTR